MYLHFYIEHTHGHHKRVATREDPATSRRNETLFQFLPRSVIGSFISAWKYEDARLRDLNKKKLYYLFENRMIWYVTCYLIFPLVMLHFYGYLGMIVFTIAAVQSFLFLEIVNYIEHYGLSRKEIAPGVYEKVILNY